ncbi:MAG: hypothetical protein IJF14_03785 [Clostridia bacterium]|nr:hypothetical protein [Clostridia bacterium]
MTLKELKNQYLPSYDATEKIADEKPIKPKETLSQIKEKYLPQNNVKTANESGIAEKENATAKPDIQVQTPKAQVETPKATKVKTTDPITVTSQPHTQTVTPYSTASTPVQKNADNTFAYAQDKGNIENTSLTKDVQSAIEPTPISVQNSTTGVESTNLSDTSTASYAQSYNKSLAYDPFSEWLYKDPAKFGGKNSYLAFEKNVNGFLDSVKEDISEREGEYTNKNKYGAEYDKRTEQLNLVLDRLDWYEQYFTQTKDGWEHWKSAEEIEEMLFALRGYREKAENLLYKMSGEKSEIDKYTTKNHWLTYTDPVGALEKINSADMDNLTDQQKADIEELTKWLSQYNTERALTDALKWMSEGGTYEDVKAERDLTSEQLGVLRTGKGIYRSETTAFEKNLIKGYENYLAYLDMIMGFFEDVKYMSYRNREDYYSLGIPKVPRGLKDSEKKGIAEQNYNKPYYYINDIFESRDEYKVNALLQEEDLTKYNYMTEAEIRTYNYIYATEGEKSANKYLDYLTDQKSYWVNEQGEYVLSETGLNYRKGKNMAQNANWLDYIEIMAKSGTDSYANRIKQLFTKDPLPKSEYEYAYEYLYNNASENGKNIMGAANDVTKKLPITVIGGAAEQMGIPMIGTIAGTIYDCLDANYKAVQEGVAPIERSNRIISAAVKSVGTSAITGIVQKMLPQMSDEVKEMWASNGNDFIKLLKKLELYVLDSTTEDEITKIVESWFNDVDDRNVNVEDAARLSYYKIIKALNQDQTFQDNKYSQFSRHEQEMLKLLEKSYKAGTIVKQEYESEIRRFAHHMKKDSKEYLDYIKLLGIL